MLPRGLVTAVLALEIVSARGVVFAFLPAMAFTVILVTNLFVVVGAVRSAKASAFMPSSTGEPYVMEELKLPSVDVPSLTQISDAGQGEK
jgi:hypothetical protein